MKQFLWNIVRRRFRRGETRVLALHEKGEIAITQIVPYLALPQANVCTHPWRQYTSRPKYLGHADVVLFQTWFNLGDDQMRDAVASIRRHYPAATLVYLDWFAATDLRYASVLSELVDVYVKKQTFVRFSDYERETLGDTNLTDFYNRRYGLADSIRRLSVPEGFENKLVLGPNFQFASYLHRYSRRSMPNRDRSVDLHARLARKGTPWYFAMRTEASKAVDGLSDLVVVREGRVPRRKFMAELESSRLCFSPFGYGEVCWRDFEAWATGSLLLKPDMSHLRLPGDPFQPFETYVPLKWDSSDLEEKARHYLRDGAERNRITAAAFEKFRQICTVDHVQEHWREMLSPARTRP